MIAGFRHKGLKRFYEKDERKGVPPDLADKIARILARLDVARAPEQMDLPGLKLHALKGGSEGLLVGLGERKLADYLPLRRDGCDAG